MLLVQSVHVIVKLVVDILHVHVKVFDVQPMDLIVDLIVVRI